MGKICFYFDYLMNKINLYSNNFIRESGMILFILILLGIMLMLIYVWQKIKIRKAEAVFLQNRAFED